MSDVLERILFLGLGEYNLLTSKNLYPIGNALRSFSNEALQMFGLIVNIDITAVITIFINRTNIKRNGINNTYDMVHVILDGMIIKILASSA